MPSHPLCALCIAAVYGRFPLTRHGPDGDFGRINSVQELEDAHALGHPCYEPGQALAVGVYARTYVRGVAMCVPHSLYVVHRLDLDRLCST